MDGNRRKQVRDCRARADRLLETQTVRLRGAEVFRLAAGQVVTDDAESVDAVMEMVEARRLELSKTARYHATPGSDAELEAMIEMDIDAVGEEVTSAKPFRIFNQVVEVETDRRIVSGNHRAGADADDSIEWHAVANQFTEHANVRGATQTPGAEDDGNPNRVRFSCHGFAVLFDDPLAVALLRGFDSRSRYAD